MTVHADWSADRCRLRIEADLTIYHAAELKQHLLDPLVRARTIEVDLSQVAEMDSAGLQLLVLLKREAAAAGKQVNFSGHSPAVIRLLDLYDMAGHFGDPVVLAAA